MIVFRSHLVHTPCFQRSNETLTPASGEQVPWSHTSNVVGDDAGVSSACFRTYNCSMWNIKLNIKFRKLGRAIVGAPGDLDWSAPWHDIRHEWNARVLNRTEQAGVKLRCGTILRISKVHCRGLKRALAWMTGRRRKFGRPRNTWDSQIQMHCRWQCLEKGAQQQC